jgi:hypothetical protein
MLMAYMVVGALGLGLLLTGVRERRPKDEDRETTDYLRQTMASYSGQDQQRLLGYLATSAEDRVRYAIVKIIAGVCLTGLVGVLILLGIY